MNPTGPPPIHEAALLRCCRAALAKHRRRARADRQRLDYGLEDLLALARSSPACCYCGRLLHPGALAFDHARPVGRVADYRLANLACCCAPCNLAKGVLSGEEFKQLLGLLRTWHPRAGADVLARLRSGDRRYRPR